LLILCSRFQIKFSEGQVEEILKSLEISKEEILEFVYLVGELYPIEYPYWFEDILFGSLIDSDQLLREILPLLPKGLQTIFKINYGSETFSAPFQGSMEHR
jgi:hypothetical protein